MKKGFATILTALVAVSASTLINANVANAQGATNAIAGVVSGRIIYHVADAGQQSA